MAKKTTKTSSRKRPTPKQVLWLKCYLDASNPETFLNKAGSARAAGYNCKGSRSFGTVGIENYEKLRCHIEKWLDEEGLGEARLKQLLVEGMSAKETKFFANQGVVMQEVDVIAWETRRKYLEMAMKVKGMFAPEKHEHKHSVDPWGDILDSVTKTNSDDLPNRTDREV